MINKKPTQLRRNDLKAPDAGNYDKDNAARVARGSSTIKTILEGGEIRSTNFKMVAGTIVSGWRLTRRGLEIAGSGTFPPGFIQFADIQNISGQTLLGSEAGGVIAQLTLDETLQIASGILIILTQMSIVHDSAGLKLEGDDATPGNNAYYGTDGSGNKGFNALPITSIEDAESQSGITPVADGTYTIGDRITPVTGDLGQITVQSGIITAVQEAS